MLGFCRGNFSWDKGKNLCCSLVSEALIMLFVLNHECNRSGSFCFSTGNDNKVYCVNNRRLYSRKMSCDDLEATFEKGRKKILFTVKTPPGRSKSHLSANKKIKKKFKFYSKILHYFATYVSFGHERFKWDNDNRNVINIDIENFHRKFSVCCHNNDIF